MRSGLTLPQRAAKMQPLRVGLSKSSAYRRVNTQINPNHQSSLPQQQALRLGLLAGQALERSDNPATIRRNVQPLRVGLSKPSAYRRVNTQINPNHQSSLPHHKPLGLVFWQGRRWSEATTLPQSAAKMQPLRVGLSKSSAYIRLYMLINQTTKAHPCNNKPLGLVFWQGRC